MLRKLLAHLGGKAKVRPPAAEPPQAREAMLSTAARLHAAQDYSALETLCSTYLEQHGDDTDALRFLATAAAARGNLAASIDALRRAVALMPDAGATQLALARLLLRSNRVDEALEVYRAACTGGSAVEASVVESAALLHRLGRYDEAEQRAREMNASSAARHVLSRALFEQGRVEECLQVLRALIADPNVSASVHSDYLRTLNYADSVSAQALYRAHREWAERHTDALPAQPVLQSHRADPGRRLKVGFVSPHFRKHAVTFFFESVLDHFDPAQCEIALFSDAREHDAYSQRLRVQAASWHESASLDDAAFCTLVRNEHIDILIDLTGHTPGNRLLAFARRPAPLAMTWNGYPNTTGMRAMDYRITDSLCDPLGTTEALHAERLLRLPGPFMTWQAPKEGPARRTLGHREATVFGSFNACYKLSNTTLALWARILTTIPDARLLLAAVPAGIAEQRVRRTFQQAGVDPARLEFHPRVAHDAFLQLHDKVDIALDPVPYHGTTTTCFSLWMGVPVVSLAGSMPVSRVGVSLLSHCGLASLVAYDSDQYVSIACALANANDRLQELHATLRARVETSALTDGNACARNLQAVWREAWTEWCVRAANSVH